MGDPWNGIREGDSGGVYFCESYHLPLAPWGCFPGPLSVPSLSDFFIFCVIRYPTPQKAKDKYNKQDHYPKLNDVTFTSTYVCLCFIFVCLCMWEEHMCVSITECAGARCWHWRAVFGYFSKLVFDTGSLMEIEVYQFVRLAGQLTPGFPLFLPP